jgi:hypothetical protein
MTTTDLYGGAIKAILPGSFTDASNFRQVPDHQEVFVNDQNNDSIVFDILERLEGGDEEAVKEHVKEIATLNDVTNELIIESVTKTEANKLR